MEAFFELEHTLESTLAAVQQPNASAQVNCLHHGSLHSALAGMLILPARWIVPLHAATVAVCEALESDA